MKFTNDHFELAATDLSNHLSCRHLTQLNRRVAQKQISRPSWHDPIMDILRDRGLEHEKAYVHYLEAQGKQVANMRGQGPEAVMEAMQQGVDVLVQAEFVEGIWKGIADILVKVDRKSDFSAWSYEVQDTKLAQNTRAETILQLCLYSDLLARLQGVDPEHMSVIKPGNDFIPEKYRYSDFKAYYGLVKNKFERTMNEPELRTYPEPVGHCQICSWWQVCDDKRHQDDYLSLVAGIQSSQIEELKKQGVSRLEQFAEADLNFKPGRGNLDTLLKRQEQARIQLEGRRQQKLLCRTLESETGRGFDRLPQPNEGDIYLDLEGDAFFEGGGMEYLFGYAIKKEGGLEYHRIWSSNKQEEKQAFNRFMDFVKTHWLGYPGMYIYHFGAYEPSALKRLAMVHSVCEAEVDQLARGLRFIDLHQVFKESLLASVESYSLKELEKFAAYERLLELHKASSARKRVEVALELNAFQGLDAKVIRDLEAYNEDDCMATAALHDWLEIKRKEAIDRGEEIRRPEEKNSDAGEDAKDLEERTKKLFNSLTEHLPADREEWNEEHQALWLLANLLDYFRREMKSSWWEYFRIHELEPEELFEERKAITGLVYLGELSPPNGNKNAVHQYRFPPQELSVDAGKPLVAIKGETIGTLKSINLENNVLEIGLRKGISPLAFKDVHIKDIILPHALIPALHAVAMDVQESGLGRSGLFIASKDLLMKRKPEITEDQAPEKIGQNLLDQAIRMGAGLKSSVLGIQGPPGTGKTFTGSRMILDLHRQGKKIGITAVSHKVIRNLAKAIIKEAGKQTQNISIVHKISGKKQKPETEEADPIVELTESKQMLDALEHGRILCGTAYFWAEEIAQGIVDYLFIDEAGQMSLAHTLAASRAAKNLVLLGDPQQLEQPQKGAHPEGSDIAALSHLLDGHLTIPETKGLFLGSSWRLHPEICRFTSELFYENRLHSKPGLEKQRINGTRRFDGAGLFYVPVRHKGNQSRADEEVAAISAIIGTLLAGGQWTNEEGETHYLVKKDILIVAPFNAQVSALRQRIPGLNIGTVDKFQGQEAPVVIYSMTSSSAEDAPRGMNFLYNLNRLNVATSRAKCICILVASPSLFEPECHSIEQMKLANALCRYREMAREVDM